MGLSHPTAKSFSYAFTGLKTALKQEPNFRIHIVIALLALILAVFLKLTPIEWVLLIFTICFVLILELLNTSIESVVDLVSPELKPEAKIAKDVSAAMVLLSAFVAILVGVFLFMPKLMIYPIW